MARSPRRTPDVRRVVGYVRLSPAGSREDIGDALGPGAQRAALARWCTANASELVTVFEDLDVSGGAVLDKRPGLLAALTRLEVAQAGTLLVAKRDRLARDVMNAAMIERLVERVGARVVSAAGEGTNGDAADPSGMLMRGIVDLFAQYERAVIRSRTRAALAVKAGRGERVGGVPYGYRLALDGVRLEAEPTEQRGIGRARELRAAGISIRQIAALLVAEGVPPRGTRWHATTVARLLDPRRSPS